MAYDPYRAVPESYYHGGYIDSKAFLDETRAHAEALGVDQASSEQLASNYFSVLTGGPDPRHARGRHLTLADFLSVVRANPEVLRRGDWGSVVLANYETARAAHALPSQARASSGMLMAAGVVALAAAAGLAGLVALRGGGR